MSYEEVIIIVENEQEINIISQDVIEQVFIDELDSENVIITVLEDEIVNIISQDIIEEIIITSENVVERIIERNVNLQTYTAGEILGGQRLVMLKDGKAFYYDITNENNLGTFIGITNQSSVTDTDIDVYGFGQVINFGWGLTPNATYYAGTNGQMTTTAPTLGILQRIGVAVDANTLRMQLSEPLILI